MDFAQLGAQEQILSHVQETAMGAPSISATKARNEIEHTDALLVCAYGSQEKFAANHLHGAISLEDLKAREPDLADERELIFYCHCPNDEVAMSRVDEFQHRGYDNAKVLEGGVDAWKKAGFRVKS